jgi:hypothetical protein
MKKFFIKLIRLKLLSKINLISAIKLTENGFYFKWLNFSISKLKIF